MNRTSTYFTLSAMVFIMCAFTSADVAFGERVIYRSLEPDGALLVTHESEEVPADQQRPAGPNIPAEESRLLRWHHYKFLLEPVGHARRQQLYVLTIEELGPLFRIIPRVGIVRATTDAGHLAAVFYYDERLFVLLVRDGRRIAQMSLPEEQFPGPDLATALRIHGSPADDDLRISLSVTSAHDRQTRDAELQLIRTADGFAWHLKSVTTRSTEARTQEKPDREVFCAAFLALRSTATYIASASAAISPWR